MIENEANVSGRLDIKIHSTKTVSYEIVSGKNEGVESDRMDMLQLSMNGHLYKMSCECRVDRGDEDTLSIEIRKQLNRMINACRDAIERINTMDSMGLLGYHDFYENAERAPASPEDEGAG